METGNIMTGRDGQLYVIGSDRAPVLLAEADSFTAQAAVSATEYQPIGSFLSRAVPASYTVTISFSEAVIRDDILLAPLFAALAEGTLPRFEFCGRLCGESGRYERQVSRDCVPVGNIDLMHIKPGEIVRRQWSFRVNEAPALTDGI